MRIERLGLEAYLERVFAEPGLFVREHPLGQREGEETASRSRSWRRPRLTRVRGRAQRNWRAWAAATAARAASGRSTTSIVIPQSRSAWDGQDRSDRK